MVTDLQGSKFCIIENNTRKLARRKAKGKTTIHCTCEWLTIHRWLDYILKTMLQYGGNQAAGNKPGVTTTTQRCREILALARKHDFLILEGAWFCLS